MMDWDAGVCLGCGRTVEEIEGVPAAPPPAPVETDRADGPRPSAGNTAGSSGEGSE
nr:DUF1289 domain-containing protein [Zoogloeaceae bacterium]